ncbi:MAG TPA: glycoside hydrolase family 36 protein [Kribbella sp.]
MKPPSAVFVQTDPSDGLIAPSRAGAEVTWNDGPEGASIEVTATRISRVALRWQEKLPSDALILGDAWERSYGDLQWRHQQPERFLPWYFLVHDPRTGTTTGAGVDVQPNAFCSWTVDGDGFTLWLDLRNGGGPVQLDGRTLAAAVVRRFEDAGTPWQTLNAAVASLSTRLPARPEPAPVAGPVVGANNWYYAYGENFDEKAVLQDASTIVELADGHPVKPFSVVDDGWYPGGIASGGPWDRGTPGVFDDLAGTAAAIKQLGARPGLWFRPLLVREPSALASKGPHDKPGRALDPSYPEVLDGVRADLQRFKDWGFELVKHDFSTYDVFGNFGPAMGSRLTRDGWQLHDPSRTTAEIVLAFYREIRAAADGVVLIGCNTVGHLAAGLVDVQRIGDDTSGRDWERTRKMGVNTLAFRLPQHNRFFTVDADCVPCTPQTPWELNARFLDVVARSGTALFLSIDPAARTAETDRALRAGIRLALDGGTPGGIEPADWLTNTTPTVWRSGDETITYDWSQPWGADPNG